MTFFKWRSFIITAIVCLLPVILGVALWPLLPDTMAIHFNIYGEADGFASKGFVVFAIPLMMVALQTICCIINDINASKHGERKKFETVTKWTVPFLAVSLQILTLGYGLGWDIDIRKSVALIIGVMFIAIGNYLPKFDRIKNYDIDAEKARKINRFMGYETVIMGILFCASIPLPPVSTMICVILLIPFAIVSVIYGIITGRK